MSREREEEDFDDRFTKGKDSIYVIVEEIPETCEECPFYTTNVNQDVVMNDDPKYYCFLRAKLVSAQYGGIDVSKNKEFKCPLLRFDKTDEYEDHEERITELEEKVTELEEKVEQLMKCCEEMHQNQ